MPHIADNGLADWNLGRAIARHIDEALEYCEGDKKWAARELGISGSTLWRHLKARNEGKAQTVRTHDKRRAA